MSAVLQPENEAGPAEPAALGGPTPPPLALVCGYNQLVEAALVLSCMPTGAHVLLLVQQPPPHDHAEFKRRFAIFRQHFDRRNELIGGSIGWVAAGPQGRDELKQLQPAVTDAMRALGPYRSWYAHQRSLRTLAHRLAPREALLLTDDASSMLTLQGISRDELDDGKSDSLLPDGTPVHRLTVADESDPEAWVQAAWQRLRPVDPLPERRVAFDRDDMASCLCALREAMASGLPLRHAGPVPRRNSAIHHAALQPGATEVVLIEAAAEADLLLGVLYAVRHGNGVIAYPRPATAPIDAALAAIDAAREAASKQAESMLSAGLAPEGMAEPNRPKLIDRILRWLRSQREDGLDAVSRAVTAAVPLEVATLVGDAAVTVLSDGVPYRFLRHRGIDWANKPIGHIVGDRALLLLTALHPSPPLPVATFDMLFDPGFFEDTGETRNVINALAGRRSYALVLNNEVGNSDALLNLSAELPVELIYFNTHGSREGIQLSDQVVQSFKLAQWLHLPSRPVVFNSSCLSWQGVGTQFVRCGASGYVGTLWSVSATDAAELARVALHRMVREGAACAWALCNTGVDPTTSMAYLFVGTARQRLQAAEQKPMPAAERAHSHAAALLSAARNRLDRHGQLRNEDYRRAIVARLLLEADRMIDDLLQLEPASRETLALLVERIAVISTLPAAESADRLLPLLTDAEQRLSALGPAEPQAWRLAVYRARWMENRGQLNEALALLQAIELPEQVAVHEAAVLERARSELAKKVNWPQGAHAAAQRALDINRRMTGDNRMGVMVSLGHLVQATLRLGGREDEALEVAGQGLEVAKDLHNESELLLFELDIARIQHARGHPELGEPHARSAMLRARRIFDNGAELSAVGTLCNILIETGQLEEADSLVKLGLAEAAQLRRWSSVGDFLGNAAEIAERQQRPNDALAAVFEAGQLFAIHGPYERLQGMFQWVQRWARRHAAEHVELPSVELAFVVVQKGESPDLHWPMAMQAVQLLHDWARRLVIAPPPALLERLLAHETEGKINGPGSAVSMMLHMLHALASGEQAYAERWAALLDESFHNKECSTTVRHALANWQAS